MHCDAVPLPACARHRACHASLRRRPSADTPHAAAGPQQPRTHAAHMLMLHACRGRCRRRSAQQLSYEPRSCSSCCRSCRCSCEVAAGAHADQTSRAAAVAAKRPSRQWVRPPPPRCSPLLLLLPFDLRVDGVQRLRLPRLVLAGGSILPTGRTHHQSAGTHRESGATAGRTANSDARKHAAGQISGRVTRTKVRY